MARDKPIAIEHMNADSTGWEPWHTLHAEANLALTDEDYAAGAERPVLRMGFKVAYFTALCKLRYDMAAYRIIYDGQAFNLVGYDDFQERHIEVRLTGELYG